MNPLYYELLNGTLPPITATPVVSGLITNKLPIPVGFSAFPDFGYSKDTAKTTIPSAETIPVNSGYLVLTVPGTGGLIGVIAYPSSEGDDAEFTVDDTTISTPNDIGPIPVPTYCPPVPALNPPNPPLGIYPPGTRVANSTTIIPGDSPRVLVGCGVAPNGNLITREQYWERQGDSICLAGNEKRTVSFTLVSGTQRVSSKEQEVAGSLSSSVTGGWGAVSASVSASLSANSKTFQQVTVTEESTSYISQTIKNPHKDPIMYLRWQLVDVITVFELSADSFNQKTIMTPVSSIVTSQSPVVVMGPYWINPPASVTQGALAGAEPQAVPDGLFEYS